MTTNDRRQTIRLAKVGRVHIWLTVISVCLLLAGFLLIGAYAFSTPGEHVRYLGAGLFTAFASLATGSLLGFLFGIPKVVSSGELRLKRDDQKVITTTETEDTRTRTETLPGVVVPQGIAAEDTLGDQQPTGAAATRGSDEPSPLTQFTPSTNLAEVSDWLTKLLLGAGLVSLTQLGRPLGDLVNAVAGGLEAPSANASAVARVMAAALMVMYFVVGFIGGYVVTTLWYGRQVQEI